MAGFKRSQPGLRFNAGEKVTADEQDVYEVYNISSPGTAASWFGTCAAGGTSAVTALGVANRYPDYPRNMNYILVGTGAGMAGTFVTNGYDQFGSPISETVAIATAANGGTVVGTAIFGRFDSGTISFGTAVGNGTVRLGFVPGTACLFGLPVKIAGTTDIALASMTNGTGAISWNGGTVGGYVKVTPSAILTGGTLSGSETLNIWIKPSLAPDSIPVVSNLKLAV